MGSSEYRLGKLKGQFVVAWWEGRRRRRYRLRRGITQIEARAELRRFVKRRALLEAAEQEDKTVGDIYQAFLRDREIDGQSIDKHTHSWKALAPYFASVTPGDIDKKLCREFQADRVGAGRSLGTVWTDLSCLRASLNWARKEKLIATAPFIWLPPPPIPRERYLTHTEAERLLDAAVTPHVRLFIHLALRTGARAGAILDLTWNRVDLTARMIDLRSGPQNATKRRPVVPINDGLFAALTEAKKAALTNHVIEWACRRVRTIKRAFSRSAERAGLLDVTPHTLRHTAAVWMAEAGVPMSEIAQYLGHADSRLTERVYARFSPGYLRKASEALEMRPVRGVKR